MNILTADTRNKRYSGPCHYSSLSNRLVSESENCLQLRFSSLSGKNYFISWEIIWFKCGSAWGPVRSAWRWHGDIWYEILWHDIILNISLNNTSRGQHCHLLLPTFELFQNKENSRRFLWGRDNFPRHYVSLSAVSTMPGKVIAFLHNSPAWDFI